MSEWRMSEMGSGQGVLWRVTATLPDENTANALAAVLGSMANAVSAFEMRPGGAWKVEAYATEAPDRSSLDAAAALAALAFDVPSAALLDALAVERLAPRDWVRENQQSFPPIRVGRFFIYGSHHDKAPPSGAIALRIDAATAFGTGEHATTRGCLIALTALGKRRRFRQPLDMGTGTGILAMAAARRWSSPALACDIDAGSVHVARENVRQNGLAARIRLLHGNGYRHTAIRRAAPFDLVTANILARPLAAMAGDLAAALAPCGVAILSGLLTRQVPLVLAAHRARGLGLRRRISVEGWETLVLERRRC
ncbi:MAG TPA: 50S ribosomal protein L11 methyltransferase [Stellaceae bacterium]|nr:50S ribosomal protein L11 methyltransferase [Stellaceae bacterium]